MTASAITRLRGGLALAALCALAAWAPAAPLSAAENRSPLAPACDRACLVGFADRYMAALAAHDPASLPWADRARFSENNVMLRIGDGLWGTASGKAQSPVTVADPASGQVGLLALVEQRGAKAYFALRLKIEGGRITEAETLVNQPAEGAAPSPAAGDPKTYFHYPHMDAILTPAQRTARLRMIDLSNGYFSTLQLNDGHIFTAFTDDCRRQENGFESTLNPKFDRPEGKLSCEAQFKLGNFIFDTAVRDRDYMVVDEEKGLVLSRAFIDHSAAETEAKLADGTVMKSWIKKPGSLGMLELFHMTNGRLDRIEVVHVDVPYRMPSVWRRGE